MAQTVLEEDCTAILIGQTKKQCRSVGLLAAQSQEMAQRLTDLCLMNDSPRNAHSGTGVQQIGNEHRPFRQLHLDDQGIAKGQRLRACRMC